MDPLGPAEQHHTAKRQLSACWNKRAISSSHPSALQAATAAPELWLSSDTVSLDSTPFFSMPDCSYVTPESHLQTIYIPLSFTVN